jgi:lipid-A-disaccharide synthase
MQSKKVFISAAEASSGQYAQRLIEHLQKQGRGYSFFGIGTNSMERLGFSRVGKSEEMAVVGIQEVIPKLKFLRQVFYQTVARIEAEKPDCIILMDYSGFNLRLAKAIKALGIPIIYYVSPQVWAWKQYRVKHIKRLVDKMLVILPFEEKFYQDRGVSAQFVGHPLLDEVKSDYFDPAFVNRERMKFSFMQNDHVLGLMPGSRMGEIKNHLGIQILAAEKLATKVPNLRVAVLLAPTLDIADIREFIPQTEINLTFVKMDPFEMVSICDTLLVASGTATLTVGLLEKPMVIMYRSSRLSAFLARLLIKIPAFGLINLIMGKKIAPEFFQEEASPETLAEALFPLITPGEARENQIGLLQEMKTLLGEGGATARVAEIVEKTIQEWGVVRAPNS